MFVKELHRKSKSDIRYGTTKVSYQKTFVDIMKLLDKHDCSQVMTYKEGDNLSIAFTYLNKTYLIPITKVYVNGKYEDKIGIRVIFRQLETMLELANEGFADMETLMLGCQLVRVDGENKRLAEVIKTEPAKLLTWSGQ